MRIIYSIVNFLILFGIIFLIGRRKIVSIFRDRRLGILAALDRAEAGFHLPESEPLPELKPVQNITDSAIRENTEKLEKLKRYELRDCRELELEKIVKERNLLLKSFTEKVRVLYAAHNTDRFEQQRNSALLDLILQQIRLTDGDRCYLRQHGVLYVTLTGASPLSQELIARADAATTALLATVGGKTSFRVAEKPELIGGVRLRIGDTVYDATVAEELYQITAVLEKRAVEETDTVETLLACLTDRIGEKKSVVSVYQLGRVLSVSDGICWMDGLADIMYGEVVEFDCGERGMVLDIQKDRIGCVIFGGFEHIESLSKVRRVGRIASVPVGDGLLGRVVNAIGTPIDGGGSLRCKETRPVENPAPAILDRASVDRPMHTGIKAIDAMTPIGRGQRELLVGDRQTGKTSIVLDTILNQRGKDVVCIYVGIGQKETTIADLREKLESHGAADYTIIVSGSASESAAMQYMAPFAATAMGEYFMYHGRDVLIIYDDLSKHAVAYRELSLLLQRPSGREAYPGDIFYLHSRLLERSAQLSEALGGGSMTALPIIETQAGDISSYIPTNVISITDGQIFLESELFREGQRPAVNVGLSVSRVGGAAQTKLMKQISASLRTKLAQYRELAEFTRFGADVDAETQRTLNSGEHLTEALKQGCFRPLEDWKQALLLYAVSEGLTDDIPTDQLRLFEPKLYAAFEKDYAPLKQRLESGKKMDETLIAQVREAVAEIVKRA